MNKFYALISTLLILAFSAQAQGTNTKVLYDQNFTTAPSGLSGWTVSSTYLFTPNNTTTGNFLRTSNTITTNKRFFVMQEPVSTIGLVGATVTWNEYRTQHWNHNDNGQSLKRDKQNGLSTKIDNVNPIVLEYSFDGVTYTSAGVVFSQNTTSFYTWAPINGGNLIYLPEQVLNKDKVYFRWSIIVDATNQDFYAMDNIRIEGEMDMAAAPLPVELLSFKGAMQGASASLTWVTAQEINNEKFIVERSQDGQNFSVIGEVKGHGNSSTRLSYTFTDTNPVEGINYYRLRQVDFDGANETSKVITLQFKGLKYALNGNIAKVYPTIAATEVQVSLSLLNADVTVLDSNGRQVAQYSNASQSLTLPVNSLKPGVYFVKVSDGQQQQTQRFIKQ